MALTNISQLTGMLPPELLAEVLAYAPVPDILRMKQVQALHHRVWSPAEVFGRPLRLQANRYLSNFIQDSPYFEYRIGLFTVGWRTTRP